EEGAVDELPHGHGPGDRRRLDLGAAQVLVALLSALDARRFVGVHGETLPQFVRGRNRASRAGARAVRAGARSLSTRTLPGESSPRSPPALPDPAGLRNIERNLRRGKCRWAGARAVHPLARRLCTRTLPGESRGKFR